MIHIQTHAAPVAAHASFRPLRSLVVDDEEFGRRALCSLLDDYCDTIRVVGQAASAAQAREAVERLQPEVVFLDVKMPGENGFQFLESLAERTFLVVFVSAYDEFALRAIKANAVDYLVKPVKIRDLRYTTRALHEQHRLLERDFERRRDYAQHIEALLDSLRQPAAERKIILKHARGFDVVALADIVHLTAERNYTSVHLSSGRSIVVSRTLSDFETMVDPRSFFRTHKSHLINLAYLEACLFEDMSCALLRGGRKAEISRRRTAAFLEAVKNYTHNPV